MTSGTLKGYMRRLKAIKPKVIRSWGRQILRGLHFLHTRSQPIIHRDLKCDNIFINGTTGLVKIGDLGLATLKRSDVKTVIGTPEFMAPEMYDEHYDESVDVYAFGMCLLEMSSGEYPYMECSNPAQIYKRVTQGIMPHALEKVRDPVLRNIIYGCITLNKQKRYSVKDLLDHEFFAEIVKFELLDEDEKEGSVENHILTMRMEVPTKETPKTNKGQESIEFVYDLQKDDPAEIVKEMVKTGVLRNEDQKSAVRSLREYLDPIKQKKQQKDSTAEGPTAKEQQRQIPLVGAVAPTLSTITESTATTGALIDEESLVAPPKLQRLTSEEGAMSTSVITSSTTTATTTTSTSVEVGGDVGGAEEGGGPAVANIKGQEVVGGVWPNGTTEVKSFPAISQPPLAPLEGSTVKRSEMVPVATPISRAPPELTTGVSQNPLSASSQSNIAVPDHQTVPSSSLLEEDRKPVRTNSNESEKGQQGQPMPAPSDEKQPVTSEASSQLQKDIVVQPTAVLSVQTSSPRLLAIPVEQGTTAHSDDVAVAAPSNTLSTATLQAQELGVVQSEHSAESTPTHFSHGSLESTSSSTISSQEQLSSQEVKGEKERSSADKPTGERGTNGTLKKKGPRGKLKQIKLNFVEMTDEKVVKCALVTVTGQMVNFQFSMKYDKPLVMFQKLVTAGHLASQHEDEFVRQIKNILSSTKKYSSTESVTTVQPPASTSTTGKESKATPTPTITTVHEPAEVKISTPLEGKSSVSPSVEPPSTTMTATTSDSVSSSSTSATSLLPMATTTTTTTTIAPSTDGLVVSASASMQQSLSQPSSPTSESVKMTFPDTVHSATTSAKVVPLTTTTTFTTLAVAEDVAPTELTSGAAPISTAAAVSIPGRLTEGMTYSIAAINGASKTTFPVSSYLVATQPGTMTTAMCNIVPNLQSCTIPAPQQSGELAPPTKRKKVFEVETVSEVDSPSPDNSEISTHSSVENLSIEPESAVPVQEPPVLESVRIQSATSASQLESKSDSYIDIHQRRVGGMVGVGGGQVEFCVRGSSNITPEPTQPNINIGYQEQVSHHLSNVQQMSDSLHVHRPLPVPQQVAYYHNIAVSEATLKDRSLSVGNVPQDMWGGRYCHYNTAPQSHGVSARQPIASDTFYPPVTHTYHHGQQYVPQVRLNQPDQPHVHQVIAQPVQPVAGEEVRLPVHSQQLDEQASKTYPQLHGISTRQPITSDTFYPPATHTYHHGQQYVPQVRLNQPDQPHVHQVIAQPVQPVVGEVVHIPGVAAHLHQLDEQASKPHHSSLSTEQQRKSSPARALTIHDFPQAELLSQAFMQFMYSMSTVFRDPMYQPLIDSLDKHFGGGQQTAKPNSAPPTVVTEAVQQEGEDEVGIVVRSNTHPASVYYDEEGDSHLKSILMQYDEEKRELERRKLKAIEDYHRKREKSSGASSLESSGHLTSTSGLLSESHDVANAVQSPSQSRRTPAVDLQNYQAGNIAHTTRSSANQDKSSVPQLESDPTTILEKKVRDEIFAEFESPPQQIRDQLAHDEQQNDSMMLSTRNFTSPPGVHSPRHLPAVHDSNVKSMSVIHQHGSKLHQRSSEGSPMSPPPSSSSSTQSPVPKSPTIPTATFTLHTSPPPAQQQPVWVGHTLPHHGQHLQHHQQVMPSQRQQPQATTAPPIHHSDSSEWTEFASAPYNVGQQDTSVGPTALASSTSTCTDGFHSSYSTPALGTLTSCTGGRGLGGALVGHPQQQQQRTDLSEFDPIHLSSAGGVSSELGPVHPPSKHRT